jgi:hypothetical protein
MISLAMLWAPLVGCASAPVGADVVPRAPDAAPPAQVVTAAAGSTCDAEAYVRAEAQGVPVFASPDGSGAPIGTVPAVPPDTSSTMRLHLAGTAPGGWVLYDRAESLGDPVAASAPDRGWVRRDALQVDLAMSAVSPALSPPWKVPLRASPSTTAEIVRTYEQEPHVARVLSCTGTWLEVSVELPDTEEPHATGWLHPLDYCSHPFTVCSGKGNSLEHATDAP